MATQIKIWEVSQGRLATVDNTSFAAAHTEKQLEQWICESPDVLGEDLLIISRQLEIPGVGRLDLLGMNADGRLVIIDLKRDLSPREAVAQALDYASWLDAAREDDVRTFSKEYLKRDLDEVFREHFHTDPPEWLCETPE